MSADVHGGDATESQRVQRISDGLPLRIEQPPAWDDLHCDAIAAHSLLSVKGDEADGGAGGIRGDCVGGAGGGAGGADGSAGGAAAARTSAGSGRTMLGLSSDSELSLDEP